MQLKTLDFSPLTNSPSLLDGHNTRECSVSEGIRSKQLLFSRNNCLTRRMRRLGIRAIIIAGPVSSRAFTMLCGCVRRRRWEGEEWKVFKGSIVNNGRLILLVQVAALLRARLLTGSVVTLHAHGHTVVIVHFHCSRAV